MQRETLMSQVVSKHMQTFIDVDLSLTMTTPHKMKQLAREHGLRFQPWHHQFHLVKFVPFIDTDGEEDAEMIEHDFYF
jgi:hypothetical protein